MTKVKRISLLVGGISAEREVSLEKGKAVEAALISAGYDINVIDVTADLGALIKALDPKPDVVFNNLYGKGGEDGSIQSILDYLNIPYTHSPAAASAIGMDKILAKRIAASIGINIADDITLAANMHMADLDKSISRPFVIKPVREGSSVGVFIVKKGDNRPLSSFLNSFPEDEVFMCEAYIAGKELTVAVLDGQAQAVTEIIPKTDYFDYTAKYKDSQTEYQCPANVDDFVYKKALRDSEALYKTLNCAGLARCDFRYNPDQGEKGLVLLEINTQPGLTANSIGPAQVAFKGMDFQALCSHLVESAWQKSENKKQKLSGKTVSG